jgi:hypothetical protein
MKRGLVDGSMCSEKLIKYDMKDKKKKNMASSRGRTLRRQD